DFGALEAPAEFLRGKALKRQERFSEAIPSLERAAQLIPAPFNRPVWMMLSECLRHDGQAEMADVAAALAEDAASELGETISMLTLEITLETEATRSFLRGLKSEQP